MFRRLMMATLITAAWVQSGWSQKIGDTVVAVEGTDGFQPRLWEFEGETPVSREAADLGQPLLIQGDFDRFWGVETEEGTRFLVEKRNAIPLNKGWDHFTEHLKRVKEDVEVLKRFSAQLGKTPDPRDAASWDETYRKETARYYTGRARVWLAQQDYDNAASDLADAIQARRESSESYFVRGQLLQAQGQHKQAVKEFSEAIRFDPKEPRWYLGRAQAAAKLKDWERVVLDCSEVIHKDSEDFQAYILRAVAYVEQGKRAEAMQDYDAAVAIDPEDKGVLFLVAHVLATCVNETGRDGEKAVTYATKLCELVQWKRADALETLAAALAESGDFSGAVKRQREAIGLRLGEEEADMADKKEAEMRLKLYEANKPLRDG